VGADQVAVLQPDGRFVIRSLVGEPTSVDAQVQAEPKLGRIHVLRSAEQYLLLTSSDATMQGMISGGTPVLPIKGRIYAFGRATGETLWQVPALIDGYGLPLDQPPDAPTLWFLRQHRPRASQLTPASSTRTAVLCIDRRTGRLLVEADNLPSQANFHDIVADRVGRTVRFSIPGYSCTVKYTDQPAPPELPAQTSAAPGESALGRIPQSLLDPLLRGSANDEPFDSDPEEKPEETPPEKPKEH